MPGPESSPAEHEILALADQSGLGLLRFDDHLRVVLANRASHEILGRRPDTLRGRSAMETFLDHRVEALVAAAANGRAASRELPTAVERTCLVRARQAAGGGAWVSLEDVTELRRLQRIRREFVDNLSHELRTPLTTVRLLTEMLGQELDAIEAPRRVRERLATIDVETGHLVQMVNELLDLSRIEQATDDLHSGDVTVPALVEAALARMRAFAQRQGVELTADVPAGLAPIRGDEERLGQLLVNLLHNAVKFSPGGGTVTVRARAEGEEVVLDVADQGLGIPRADQPRVFERFYKADRARQRGAGGTGLGLAICRHIAEAHGGRIWLESREGRGSVFHVALPASAGPTAAPLSDHNGGEDAQGQQQHDDVAGHGGGQPEAVR